MAGRKGVAAESATLEDTLWKAADKLRGSMDAADYKHFVLGLVFLKYVSDAFTERHEEIKREIAGEGITGAGPRQSRALSQMSRGASSLWTNLPSESRSSEGRDPSPAYSDATVISRLAKTLANGSTGPSSPRNVHHHAATFAMSAPIGPGSGR